MSDNHKSSQVAKIGEPMDTFWGKEQYKMLGNIL